MTWREHLDRVAELGDQIELARQRRNHETAASLVDELEEAQAEAALAYVEYMDDVREDAGMEPRRSIADRDRTDNPRTLLGW